MKRLFWLGVWVAAIASLSQTIQAARTWSEAMSVGFVIESLAWLVLLAAAVFLLTLRVYAIERARGAVVRRVGVFERILERGVDSAE